MKFRYRVGKQAKHNFKAGELAPIIRDEVLSCRLIGARLCYSKVAALCNPYLRLSMDKAFANKVKHQAIKMLWGTVEDDMAELEDYVKMLNDTPEHTAK